METEKCLKNPSVIILGFSLDVIGMVDYKLRTYVSGLYETITEVADGHWDITKLASSWYFLNLERVYNGPNKTSEKVTLDYRI